MHYIIAWQPAAAIYLIRRCVLWSQRYHSSGWEKPNVGIKQVRLGMGHHGGGGGTTTSTGQQGGRTRDGQRCAGWHALNHLYRGTRGRKGDRGSRSEGRNREQLHGSSSTGQPGTTTTTTTTTGRISGHCAARDARRKWSETGFQGRC